MVAGPALLIFLVSLFHTYIFVVQGLNSEVFLGFQERAKYHGYHSENHQIVTDDDYILTLYRIPYGLEKPKEGTQNRSVVFIVHGMGGSAHNFLTLGRKKAPAFYFADQGFDVWLICVRGCDCDNPKKHVKYDWKKNKEYWDYSVHEIGIYDVSKSIDYIINATGQEKLFCIGHSSGGAEFLILTSERPEYNNKIKILANWGQSSYLKHLEYPSLKFLSQIVRNMKNVWADLGFHYMFPFGIDTLIENLLRQLCADPQFKKTCYWMIPGLLSNIKNTLVDLDIIEVIFSCIQRLSVQQVYHYVYNLNTGEFRKYDWGPKKNMQLYGQKVPPLYNLSACTCPNAFFYGTTDTLSSPKDNRLTLEMLPNVIMDYEVGPRFTHIDFLFARNGIELVYERVVKLFKDFDEGKIPPKITKTNTTDNK